MKQIGIRVYAVLLAALLAFPCLATTAGAANWLEYKDRFVTQEGRVLDTGNNHISHSEGQGWGMLLAQAHDDKATFEQIWQWTRRNLARRDVVLFSWRYDPADVPPVKDTNTATDGDLFIAWALHLAAERWNETNYATASRAIRRAIAAEAVRDYGGYTLLLPGIEGFAHKKHVDVNLSYWFMPALVDFAALEADGPWQQILEDGERLLSAARFGDYGLPPDWLTVNADGTLTPAANWPPRFGFEAVRIPLYHAWVSATGHEAVQAVVDFWTRPDRQPPPAWVDLETGATAEYSISRGAQAVKALASMRPEAMPATLNAEDDYYSATLLMLAHMAARDRHMTEIERVEQ